MILNKVLKIYNVKKHSQYLLPLKPKCQLTMPALENTNAALNRGLTDGTNHTDRQVYLFRKVNLIENWKIFNILFCLLPVSCLAVVVSHLAVV